MTACDSWQMFNDWQFQGLLFLFPHLPPGLTSMTALAWSPRHGRLRVASRHRTGQVRLFSTDAALLKPRQRPSIWLNSQLSASTSKASWKRQWRYEYGYYLRDVERYRAGPRDMTRNFFKQGRDDSAEEGAAQLQHVRCSFTCQMQRPVQETRTPCRFLLPPLPLLPACVPVTLQ